jgi:hypothetical protein
MDTLTYSLERMGPMSGHVLDYHAIDAGYRAVHDGATSHHAHG